VGPRSSVVETVSLNAYNINVTQQVGTVSISISEIRMVLRCSDWQLGTGKTHSGYTFSSPTLQFLVLLVIRTKSQFTDH
jgi:hypothetical protein